jgi:hypothetical protein
MASYTNVRYHTLDDPLNPKQLPNKYSDLHTLYPGRPMDSTDDFNRNDIEHEDPEAAREMFQGVKERTAQYGAQLERKARKQGGQEKMTVHAVEDPSTIIEDPDLVQTNMLNPDGSPLLMDGEPLQGGPGGPGQGAPRRGASGRGPPDGGSRKPLIENYGNGKKTDDGPMGSLGSYKWILLVLAAVALFFMAYLYSTRQIDIYSF